MVDRPDRGETFRAGVGMLVRRADGSILMLQRVDVVEPAWQLPQGGLDRGEQPEAAAWRELREEAGLTADHVTLAASTEAWFGYELPAEYQKPKTSRGQVHRWFLFLLRDGVGLPALPEGRGAEFRSRRWMEASEVMRNAAPFRRAEYREVLDWVDSLCEKSG